jgi:hypothetical protein
MTGIKELARKLQATYKVAEIEVIVHYVIVSSMDVVPKSTIKSLNDMFKVQNRVRVQTINLIAKRM